MKKNFVEPGRPQMTIWRIACWISEVTVTHSACDVLIAFPLHFHGLTAMLRYTCIACLV